MPVSIVTPEKKKGEVIGHWDHAILLIWIAAGDVLMFQGSLLTSTRMAFNKIKKNFGHYTYPKISIIHQLTLLYDEFDKQLMLTCADPIPLNPLDKISSYQTEANGQEILEKLLTDYIYERTNEGCLADSIFAISDSPIVMQIQLKTTRKVVKQGHFHFRLKKLYGGLIVIAMALTLDLIFVIPGVMLPEKAFGGSPAGKYKDFLCSKTDIPKLLKDIYQAVYDGKSTCVWPSGKEIAVDSIILIEKDHAMIPQSLMQQREHTSMLRRKNYLPNLRYYRPNVENGPVDWFIEGVAIQDKNTRLETNYYVTALTRANKIGYYQDGDFEALWLHLDNNQFYIIPAAELSNRAFFYEKGKSKGKTSISVCPSGKSSTKDLWANEYLFSYDTDDIEQKVKLHLEAIKASAELT